MLRSFLRYGAFRPHLRASFPTRSLTTSKCLLTPDKNPTANPTSTSKPTGIQSSSTTLHVDNEFPDTTNSTNRSYTDNGDPDLRIVDEVGVGEKEAVTGRNMDHLDGSEEGTFAVPADMHENIMRVLSDNNPTELMDAMQVASNDGNYLDSLPTTTVLEILRCLITGKYLPHYTALYRDIHPQTIRYVPDDTPQFEHVIVRYSATITRIMDWLVESGRPLGLQAYRLLLDHARSTGLAKLAVKAFHALQESDLKPDLDCYNYLLEAKCWGMRHHWRESYNWRVTPRRLRLRQQGAEYRSYIAGSRGLKEEIMAIFTLMLKSGIRPDTTTFTHVMLAMGREGDLEAVEDVLLKVWSIDVAKLLANDGASSLPEVTVPADSPLFPDKKLLFTVAHIYGMNNALSDSFRIIDHMSRLYSIPIGLDIWEEFCTWTQILATPRNQHRNLERKADEEIGKVQVATFEQFWTIMTSPPYNVKPSLRMWNSRIKMANHAGGKRKLVPLMREAYEMARKEFWKRYKEIDQLEKARSYALSRKPPQTELEKMISRQLRVKRETIHLIKLQSLKLSQRWIHLVLGGDYGVETRRGGRGGTIDNDWTRRWIPDIVGEFCKGYKRPAYNTERGRVHFHWTKLASMKVRVVEDTSSSLKIAQLVSRFDAEVQLSVSRRHRHLVRWEKQGSRPSLYPRTLTPWHQETDISNWLDIEPVVSMR